MNPLLRLIILFRPYWKWVLLGILISTLSLAANIILLSLSGWFITAMGLAGVAGITINYFTPAAIIRGCAIIRTGGRYAERTIMHEATFRFMAEMRSYLYSRIETMTLTQSSHYHSGDLLSRLRGDIDALEGFYINVFVPCIVSLIAFVTVFIVFFAYDASLALSEITLLLIVGAVIPFFFYHYSKKEAEKITELKSTLKEKMVTNLQSINEMIIYGQNERYLSDIIDLSDDLIARQKKLAMREGFSQSMTNLLSNSGLGLAFVMAYQLYERHAIEKPLIAMLPLMALASFESVLPLPAAFQALGGILQSARRIFALDDYKEPIEYHKPIKTSSLFEVKMESICFSYKEGQEILNGLDLSIKKGEIVFLKGSSGVGKSSIISLLTKLYEPDSGNIFVNGCNYENLSDHDVQPFFAIADQRPHIFIGTIRSNLLIAKPNASQNELDQVCKVTCLDTVVANHPDGYDSYIGESGISLSGGEKRRLAIARALLKEASCLILDEPTEGLDTATAQKIMDNVFTYAKDKAILLVSHEYPSQDDRIDRLIVI